MSAIKTSDNKIIYPVDEHCHYKGVIVVNDGHAYTCTLNQTDLKSNKNKFYIMQLINLNNKYYFFCRWGRIGEKGTTSCDDSTDMKSAISMFERQFKSKTGNSWKTRSTEFIKKDKKYYLATISYETKDSVPESINKDLVSKLDSRIQYLIQLISDTETMNKTLVQLEINPKKMPLGKISNDQINDAEKILKQIQPLLGTSNETIDELSSKFYTLIPYSCGRRKPPSIDNKETFENFSTLIEELKNLVVAVKIINDVNSQTSKHRYDAIYDQLNTEIKPLDKTQPMWKHIQNYITNTHGKTHSYQVELLDIFELVRPQETQIYDDYCKTRNISNKMLLWHGSRIVNFCSILKKGLILNPESVGAYISGRMFGNGVYTANSFSKSFNYCASDASNNIGALLLCEVALGNQLKKLQADHYLTEKSVLKDGCHSTWGMGINTPSSSTKLDDGVIIPNGKLKATKTNTVLQYDELIVYNTQQIKLKYLVLVKKL